MSHLNYFLPFDKGTNTHEDHLTRAFLILLKHSNVILQNFYTYVHSKIVNENLKPLYQTEIINVSFETQVGSLPEAETYVSILITNEELNISHKIVPVDRKPIYDGVIDFNGKLVFIIETKPNKNNVWEGQLCPATKDIPENAILIETPAVLEWKEIINMLNRINESNLTNYSEKTLISDFFEHVNLNHSELNPYNDLSKCNTAYLATKRIEQILKEIATNTDKVKNHIGWGWFIELEYQEIKKVALLLHKDDNGEWSKITIAVDFGSTVSQARNFYKDINSLKKLQQIKNYNIKCNLHLAFQSSNLVFFDSPENSLEKYFNYWNKDVWNNFGGLKKENLLDFLKRYEAEQILDFTPEKQDELETKIMNKGYQRINICPAIYCEHEISKEKATKLDKENKLVNYISEKIKEILSVIDKPIIDIK